MNTCKFIEVCSEPVSLEDIIAVSENRVKVKISKETSFINKLKKSQLHLENILENNIPVYGVTTGYGKMCSKRMAEDVALKNGSNLIRFHGCGTGSPLEEREVRASMFCRLICISRGYSAVSIELLEAIADFLNNNIIPFIPSEGSVGASGDLTPLSYIAACIKGERKVFYQGKLMPAIDAIEKAGLKPYRYKPKEPIAMMNGTSIMTGIATSVIIRSQKIINGAIAATALAIHALKGNSHHYKKTIMDAKPFKGQRKIAECISKALELEGGVNISDFEDDELGSLQDPYSLRCSPQIIGVLEDSLKWIIDWIEIEANSANDNPIIDPENGELLMGGNFYGGHIALAMDSAKAAIAAVADMCDRQVSLLVNKNVNRGLPADLVAVPDEHRMYNHGFKAMSISASALAAEALKGTMPASSFSRSTESHNQDRVSMGTIAARDAERVCELTERVIAILLLTAAQGCEIRGGLEKRPYLKSIITRIRDTAPSLEFDRPMDDDIERMVNLIKSGSILIDNED